MFGAGLFRGISKRRDRRTRDADARQERRLLAPARPIAVALTAALVGGVLSIGAGALNPAPAQAALLDPLTCGAVYGLDQSPAGAGANQHNIYSLNTASGALTVNNVVTTTNLLNALAADGEKGFFWMAQQATNQTTTSITRVNASTGATTTSSVFTLTGLPATNGGIVMGAYSPTADIYYYGVVSSSVLYIYGWNTITNAAIPGIIARVSLGAGNNGDFAFDTSGRLYIVSAGLLLSVDTPIPTTGTATGPLLPTTSIASPPGGSLGSVAFGSDGLLYLAGVPAGGTERVRYAVNPSSGQVVSTVTMTPTTNTVGDFASCASPNVIRVIKDLPSGRVQPGDQFTVSVTGGEISQGNVGTTAGTDVGLQDTPAEIAGPVIGTAGVTYNISEVGANGTVLSTYDTVWTCFDSVSQTTLASGTTSSGSFTMPDNGFAGSDVLCTFSNEAAPPALEVTKSSDATADTRAGDTVTYTVSATNTGQSDYTNELPAVVFDDLSGILDDATYNDDAASSLGSVPSYSSPLLSWTGPLAVGATVEITYTVTLNNSGNGVVRNVAWQPNDPGNPVTPACDPPVNGQDPVTGEPCAVVEYELPRLTISKSADQTDLPAVGGDVTYTVTVTNPGPGDYTAAAPATATDDLSGVLDAATFDDASLSADVGTATRNGNTLSWSGALAAGQTATITYTVTYTGGGDNRLTNNACVPSGQVAPGALACDSVTIPGAALQQWKAATPSSNPVVAGSTITYTLYFDNDGQTAATVDAVDDLTFVLDDATVTTEPTSANGLTVARNGAQISITGSVPVGQVYTVTYTVTVLPDDERGDSVATNFLLAPGDTPPTDGECVPTDPNAPDCTSTPITGITYAKSVVTSETPVREGTELTYSVTITNTGATSVDILRDDNLSDVLDDATLTGAPESDTGSVTVAGPIGDVLELRGTLAAGATAVVTYTVTVNASDARGNSLANNFLVPPGTTPPEACDPATEQCTSTPIQGYTVTKTSDVTSAAPGGVVTYTVTLVNTGAVAFTDGSPATFTDDLSEVLDDATYNGDVSPGGTVAGSDLSWAGPLAVGATVTVTYSVTVNDPRTGDGTMTNAVVPTAPGGDCDPEGACVTETPISSFTVSKTADVATAIPGDVVSYTVTVTNTGEVDYTDATPASFSDDLSGVLDDATYNGDVSAGGAITGSTLTWTGALAAGASVEVTYSVTVNDPITGDRSLLNVVTPTAPGGECDPDEECTTTTPVASYTVNKTSDQATALPGGVVTYTVTVTNNSDVDYTATAPATFTDNLAGVLDDAVYNDDASSGATVTGNVLTWSGALTAGQSIEVTYSVTVDDPVTGDFVLRNAVTPTGPGGTCIEACVVETPIGSFRVVKSTDTTDVVPGDVIEYSITVTNTGQVAYTDVSPASFTDDLSAVLDDATYNGDGASSTGSGVTYTAPTLAWSGALGVGETVTVTYSVTVNDPATGDRQLDNAVVTPPGTGGNCAPGSTDPACVENVPAGTFSIEKSVSPATALPGDVVTYTVTVTNTGQIAFTDDEPASFSDDLSRVLDDSSYNDDVSPGGAVAGTTLTWSGSLAVGEVVEVTYSVTVDDPVTGDFSLRNVVTPTSPGGECVEDGCVTVTPVAGYTVRKTSDAESIVLGGVVTYSVTVTNVGNVAYTDALPATFADDMSGVLDDATYNDDATAGATLSGTELTWAGPLEIGATSTVTYSVTVNQPATGDKLLRNAVVADGPGGGCETENGCETVTPVATYKVAKTVSSSTATVGDRLTYTITVTNTGQVPYTEDAPASFTDDLTSALRIATYNGDASSGAVYDAPVLSWQGAVDVGASVTVTYSVTVREVGQIRNVVVTPDGSGANCPTASEDPACQTLTTVVPPLAITGGALWVGGTVGAAVLLTLGLWLVARRRREYAETTTQA